MRLIRWTPAMLALAACGPSTTAEEPVVIIIEEEDMTVADEGVEPPAPRFTFPGEETPCAPNPAFEEVKPILGGGKINPTGRGEQAAVYDPCHDRVVLFGGNDNQPVQCNSFGAKNYVGDTWAYSLEYENWYRVKTATSAPPARGRHVSAFDLSRKKVYVFGGRFRPPEDSMGLYTMYNDLWSFDVNTDTWEQVGTRGDTPVARVNAAMIYDPKRDRLLLFGGNSSNNGLNFQPLSDTYSFDLKTATWTRHDNVPAPEPRLFHAMTYDSARDQALVFSGGDENAFLGDFHQDVWGLNLATMSWRRLWSGETGGPGPLGRINPGWIEDPTRSRMLMFGGHDDGFLGNANDLWSFDPVAGAWTQVRAGDVYTGAGCGSFCECAATFVTYDKTSPERRQYPTFIPIQGTEEALLFSGTGDCGYMDDTWSLDLATGDWSEKHAAEQGIACERTGREDCVELCY